MHPIRIFWSLRTHSIGPSGPSPSRRIADQSRWGVIVVGVVVVVVAAAADIAIVKGSMVVLV